MARDLPRRRRPAEGLCQLVLRERDRGPLRAGAPGEPDEPRRRGERLADRPSRAPLGERREGDGHARLVAPDGRQEADVALLDEVVDVEAEAAVATRDRDDESQVRLDQPAPRVLVAFGGEVQQAGFLHPAEDRVMW